MNEIYAAMTECAAEAKRVARAVPADRLDAKTPCTEFDLRTLVNHWVLFTSHGLECRAQRRDIPAELMERDFTAEPGWADAYAAQLDRALAAWAEPGVWEGEITTPVGAAAAPDIASLVVKEMAVHGWDVARAAGEDFRVSARTGELLRAVVEKNAELYRKYDGFADPVDVPPTASAFEQALAISGRDPRWTP
ncbi:TIGR03086 family metal-binding protein [Actinomadura atramentaria]|uniref:TIGR03086 family metal-binding protein n=1 Tax=Actinomadura atramentaria TaxID=1990 RepID=UPI0003688A83|nr:TIGR03086 family metal-binding protein [Actinomadura atramentaria]